MISKKRITMEDERRAIGRGVDRATYALRLGIDEHEAKHRIAILKNLPAISIGDDGIIRWLPPIDSVKER